MRQAQQDIISTVGEQRQTRLTLPYAPAHSACDMVDQVRAILKLLIEKTGEASDTSMPRLDDHDVVCLLTAAEQLADFTQQALDGRAER